MNSDPIYHAEMNSHLKKEMPSRIDLAKLDLRPRESHPATSSGDVPE